VVRSGKAVYFLVLHSVPFGTQELISKSLHTKKFTKIMYIVIVIHTTVYFVNNSPKSFGDGLHNI